MEIQARYTLIGLFTLAVIGAGFLFVYWLNGTGGLGYRDVYRVRHEGTVSGLLKGSAVLFNGIRVGEVTALGLDPQNPANVSMEIAIAHGAPVREDTKVGIEFQGLTGAPVVSLVGGSPTSPLLRPSDGVPPLLTMDKDAGQDMAHTARDVMKRIDDVVAENAEPLRNLIANLDKFSGALARNSDKVDGIVAGLARFTGGGQKPVPHIYELPAPHAFPQPEKLPDGQLMVAEPTTLSEFDSDKIQVKPSGQSDVNLDNAQWPDLLPKVVQTRIVQSFENAQYLRALGRTPDETEADYQLLIDIRSFHITTKPSAVAEVKFAARIMNNSGRVVGAKLFDASVQVTELDANAAVAALSSAFEKVATEIVLWTFATI